MSITNNKLDSVLVGVAGEYLVAGELTLRGYIASISLRNSRGIDIIASNADGSKAVSIQVKTNSDGKTKWMVSKKAETFHSANHYYVFVALKGLGQRPSFHIVPSKIVGDYVSNDHSEWLMGTKKDGSPRKDSSLRVYRDFEKKYEEAWGLIQL